MHEVEIIIGRVKNYPTNIKSVVDVSKSNLGKHGLLKTWLQCVMSFNWTKMLLIFQCYQEAILFISLNGQIITTSHKIICVFFFLYMPTKKNVLFFLGIYKQKHCELTYQL